MKVLFRAPVARAQVSIRVPVYPPKLVNGVEYPDTSREPVGFADYVYRFIEGQGSNELLLDTNDDPQRVRKLREYIADNPEYEELFCGSDEQYLAYLTGYEYRDGKYYAVHKKEPEDTESSKPDEVYSDWDLKMAERMKQ